MDKPLIDKLIRQRDDLMSQRVLIDDQINAINLLLKPYNNESAEQEEGGYTPDPAREKSTKESFPPPDIRTPKPILDRNREGGGADILNDDSGRNPSPMREGQHGNCETSFISGNETPRGKS